MCPGCEEWQDHLAGVVARLLRETGADGIRLDSLGFYYLPCYNPAHGHASPFDYNEWIKQLLAKVRAAAIAVKPDVLLLTEGSADWFGPWFHGALTAVPAGPAPMRLAVSPFRNYVCLRRIMGFLVGLYRRRLRGPTPARWTGTGPARGSPPGRRWYGDVRDDGPLCGPEIVARCFEGEGYCGGGTVAGMSGGDLAVGNRAVGAAPSLRSPCPGWPRKRRTPRCAMWKHLDAAAPGTRGRGRPVQLATNWALVVLRRAGGPALAGFGCRSLRGARRRRWTRHGFCRGCRTRKSRPLCGAGSASGVARWRPRAGQGDPHGACRRCPEVTA